MSLSDTLAIVQKLYEGGVVTYPRSDCPYLPESKYLDASETLKGIVGILSDLELAVKNADTQKRHSAFNDGKVAEHFAVIPTGKIGKLNDEQKVIYRLVALRYIALFWPEYEYNEAVIEVNLGEEKFTARGKVELKKGWKELFSEEKTADEDGTANNPLPDVRGGTRVENQGISITEGKTTPPDCFTEATLLAAMSNIHKYVRDEQIRKILKENEGIGTAATQAEIISKTYARGYAEKKENKLSQLIKAGSWHISCRSCLPSRI